MSRDIASHGAEHLLVCSADHVFAEDLARVYADHVDSGADATVLTYEVSRKEAAQNTVVLTDGQCFSATDIFLSGVQGLPGGTLLGETSGGGSGSPRVHALPSGLQFRAASMASFRPSGELIEGHGSVVDVRVPAAPESFLAGGVDNVLQAALNRLQN